MERPQKLRIRMERQRAQGLQRSSFPHDSEGRAVAVNVQASADLGLDGWETLASRFAGERTWIAGDVATVSIEGRRVVVVSEDVGERYFFGSR